MKDKCANRQLDGRQTFLVQSSLSMSQALTRLLSSLQDVDLRKTVDESARIQRAYNHYFDLTIVNDNLDKAFETLQAAVDKLCSEPQWVPVNWVY